MFSLQQKEKRSEGVRVEREGRGTNGPNNILYKQ
jgi:hypothetical protein